MTRRRAAVPVAVLVVALTAGGCGSATGRGADAAPASAASSSMVAPPPTSPELPPPTAAPTGPPPSTPPPPALPPAVAHRLAGQVVVLDPGHNGGNAAHAEIINRLVDAGGGVRKACNTTGTSTAAGYSEHAFTWDVANRVAALLRARGVRVVLTRHSDTGVGPCVDVRPEIADRAHAAAFVSIHADGNLAPAARGFHVIEPASPPVAAGTAARSDTLARTLQAVLRRETGLPYANYLAGGDGLDRRRDLGTLNLSTQPVAMVECGNMRSPADTAVLTSAGGRQRIAIAIADAITAYLTR